jgi:hypothetical protein
MRTRIWFKVRDRVPFIDERWMFRVGYIKDIQINEYIEQPIIKIDVEEGREKYVFPESILRIYMSEFIDNFKLKKELNFENDIELQNNHHMLREVFLHSAREEWWPREFIKMVELQIDEITNNNGEVMENSRITYRRVFKFLSIYFK